jgi:RNA polymerase sigma factor for flagellar operon FliA
MAGAAQVRPGKTAVPDEERALWSRWKMDGDVQARDRLIARYSRLARIVAATFYGKRFQDEIEFADYEQFALVGMLEAFERFDPDQGVQFRTYASRRIQGAILDGVESLTERQQQLAMQRRMRGERRDSLIALHDSEAAPSSRTPEQVLRYVADVGVGLALAWLLEGTGMLEDGGRVTKMPFYRNAELEQTRARLLQLVKDLPAQQCRVITAHYLQQVPFDDIALTLGLTKGRISQIHQQALTTLRSLLGTHPSCDVGW